MEGEIDWIALPFNAWHRGETALRNALLGLADELTVVLNGERHGIESVHVPDDEILRELDFRTSRGFDLTINGQRYQVAVTYLGEKENE